MLIKTINDFAKVVGINNKKFYFVNYNNHSNDISSKDNIIFQKPKELNLEVGWFTMQGSMHVWTYCSEDDVCKLVHSLGENDYSYTKVIRPIANMIKKNR